LVTTGKTGTTVLAGSIATTDKVALLAEAAQTAALRQWPDSVDAAALAMYAGVAFGLPAFGYWLMAIDIRRYLRSLRRALVVVARVATPLTPYWARRDDPPCLVALDLPMPCSEEQVLAAYRKRVKDLHPDRGGDLQAFLRLQKHFEQALHLARSARPERK
jgi:hypothetical protein